MNLEDIQKLRNVTGAGMVDVKNALDEAQGDFEKAKDILRKRGVAIAMKKGDRETGDGLVFSYVHAGGKVGVLLKLYCETDFVARNEKFQELGKDIALHIAAMKPQYVSEDAIPADVIEKEREIYREQAKQENADKPDDIVEKIVEGKVKKFTQEIVLLNQPFVKDTSKTIQQRIDESVGVIGENIQMGEFVCFEI